MLKAKEENHFSTLNLYYTVAPVFFSRVDWKPRHIFFHLPQHVKRFTADNCFILDFSVRRIAEAS